MTSPVTANSLYFYEPGEGYIYSFTGNSTITIGNGSSAGQATCDFGANLGTGYVFLNNVAVAGDQDLQLNSISSVVRHAELHQRLLECEQLQLSAI